MFRLDADSKPGKAEIAGFRAFLNTELQTMQSNALARTGKIGEGLASIGTAGTVMGTVVAGAAVAVVGGLFALAKATADAEGKFVDLSAKSGLTVETLSVLDVAAKLTGGSIEQVAQSAVILQRNLAEAQKGNKELTATFKALGVGLRDSAEDAFPKLFKALQGVEDQTRRTALATQIFGRSGADLLPIIAQVGGDLDTFRQKARELGLEIKTGAANAADNFGDQLILLDLQVKGLARSIGESLIPALNGLFAVMRAAKSDPGGVLKAMLQDFAQTGGFSGLNLSNKLADQDALDQVFLKAFKDSQTDNLFKPSGGKGKTKQNFDLELLKARQQFIEDAAKREIEIAEQAFHDKQILATTYADIASDAELRILDAKQKVFAAERAEIEKSKAGQTEKLFKLQEVQNAEAKAVVDHDNAVRAVKLKAQAEFKRLDEEEEKEQEQFFKDKREREQRELEALQDFLEKRNRILQAQADAARNARVDELSPLFGTQTAEQIARVEDMLGRQTTAFERARIAGNEYGRTLREDVARSLEYALDFQARFRDATVASIDTFIQSGGSLRQAGQAMVKALLAPWIQYCAFQAHLHATEAIGAAARWDIRGAVLHGLAAAGFAVLGAAGVAVGNAAFAGGGGQQASVPGGGNSRSNERRVIEQGGIRERVVERVVFLHVDRGVIAQEATRAVRAEYEDNGPMRGALNKG